MNDRELLDEAQWVIPSFHWRFITTEAFGAVAVTDWRKFNAFVFMTETEFWLDQKSGKLTELGEPLLTARQRGILRQAIDLSAQDRLHAVDLVLQELFGAIVVDG